MKKFTKVCLITSVVLVILGGVICIVGTVGGGWRMIHEMDRSSTIWRFVNRVEDSYVAEQLGNMTYGITDSIIHEVTDDFKDDVLDEIADVKDEVKDAWEDSWEDAWEDSWDDEWGGVRNARDEAQDASNDMNAAREDAADARNEMRDLMENELLKDIPEGDGDTGIASSQVKDMKIEIGGAALCFVETENDNFGVKIVGKERYDYYESKGTFHLEGGKRNFTGNSNDKVYLYVPKGKAFDEVEIDVGGGIICIGELEAQEVELTAGAGVISSEGISCHKLDVEVGAGEVVLGGITADEMDINVGMGVAFIQGGIGRKIDVECGMGSVEMELDNAETDFNYEIECAAGGISLGGKSYNSLVEDIRVDNKASGKCSLECSMGRIDVIFTR